jgi:hypothetical protein
MKRREAFTMATLGSKLGELRTYGDAIGILLSDALGLSLTLLEGMLVLKLASHIDDFICWRFGNEVRVVLDSADDVDVRSGGVVREWR